MGSSIPELVVLGSIKKQAEQTSKHSKQHPSVASAPAPASRFLPESLADGLCCETVS